MSDVWETLQGTKIPKHVNTDNCIRCGKLMNQYEIRRAVVDALTKEFFAVLCEKCNQLWISFAQRNGVSPMAILPNSRKVWIEFIERNPSSRY